MCLVPPFHVGAPGTPALRNGVITREAQPLLKSCFYLPADDLAAFKGEPVRFYLGVIINSLTNIFDVLQASAILILPDNLPTSGQREPLEAGLLFLRPPAFLTTVRSRHIVNTPRPDLASGFPGGPGSS